MKVFISWSGERSKVVAAALWQWLPDVIQSVQPWLSSEDIPAGARWGNDVTQELSDTKFGIICLTAENQTAPWILFEAGALAKTLEKTRVVPYLIDIEPTDVHAGPLAQFQAKRANKKETWKLVRTINRTLEENVLPDNQIERTFERWWPDLDNALKQLPEPDQSQMTRRPTEDMIEEMLELVRHMARSTSSYQYFYNEYMLNSKYPKEYMEKLSEREAYVITMREGYGRSIREIADIVGMSQPYIRRILKQAKDKLHHVAQIDTESKST